MQDEYGEIGIRKQSINQAIEELENGREVFTWRFVLHPDSQEIDDVFALSIAVGSCTVIAEEVPLYKHSRWLETVLLRGRRRGIKAVVTTQRPYTFSRTVSSQCAAMVVFYTDEPRDVEYIGKRYGSEAQAELESLVTPSPTHVECCFFGDELLFKPFLPEKKEDGRNPTASTKPRKPHGDCVNNPGDNRRPLRAVPV